MFPNPTTVLATSLTLAAFCSSIAAHDFYRCLGSPITWSSGSMTLRAHAGTFPSGSSLRTALTDAVNAWNACPAAFTFDLRYDEADVGRYNLQNEVWASSNDDILDGAPAICIHWSNCANWAEADIVFDSRKPWSTSAYKTALWPYGGSGRPFRTTALHELGHALGLKHEADTYNIMGEDWTHIHANGSAVICYPGEDASDGAVTLYGLAGSRPEDVGVVHWTRTSSDGEYSVHNRTRITRLDGSVCDSFTDTQFNPNGEPGYKVARGHTVVLKLNFENNGSTSQSPRVRYYLSENDYITRADTELASRRPTLNRNTVFLIEQELVIPTDLTPGRVYYLGAIVDADREIDETDEDNNATYVAIKIKE